MSDTNPEPNETHFIPDFFYEFISRIVPGLVVIAIFIFWSDSDLKDAFSTVELSLVILVGAWIIGTTLDLAGFLIFSWFLKKTFPNWEKKTNWVKKIVPELLQKENPDSAFALYDYLCNAGPWERENYYKAAALSVFFRNMASICLFTVLFVPFVNILALDEFSIFPCLKQLLPALFLYHCAYIILGVVLFFVFGYCWCAQKHSLKRWSEWLANKNKKSGDEPTAPPPTTNPKK